MTLPDYFHGGIPGLAEGALLLPPDISGTDRTLSQFARPDMPAWTARRDVVYVSTRQDDARVFAAFYPDGALYRVVPVGVVGPDPDHPARSLMCRSARIEEVIRPMVVFAHRTPASWMRLLMGTTA
ncbi:hypothetical protein AB0J38_14260 [Streptomyces sp. NPDC050095]|uniref:hypothetical protein n=1 Tax=unclassified Streptomyces TaxID=2593676 RepID=UPI0034349A26